jgi:SpoVK/Ycf46/Vps4 family AAA+-type ATPase
LEINTTLKTMFMSFWDGFSGGQDRLIVLGTTNRPQDLDPAVIRRMPLRFHVPLPDASGRKAILRIQLHGRKNQPLVDEDFDFDGLAAATSGLSGSDLKEVCRNAVLEKFGRAFEGNPDERLNAK